VSPSKSSVRSVISSVSSNKKRWNESQGMDDIFKLGVNLCADNQDSKPKSDSVDYILPYLPIKYLFGLIEQHKSYAEFLTENNMTNARKKDIFKKIDDVFEINNLRNGGGK